jgi:hypothetical protein
VTQDRPQLVAFGEVVARGPKALVELDFVGIEHSVDIDAREIAARLNKEVEEIPPALLKCQVERAVPFELEPIPALEQGGGQRVLACLQRDLERGLRSSALVNGLGRQLNGLPFGDPALDLVRRPSRQS